MVHSVGATCRLAVFIAISWTFLFGLSVASSPLFADGPNDKARSTKDLSVQHGEKSPRIVTVSLYRDGKLIRSDELDSQQGITARWRELPLGDYEVHFEAKGFKKAIKRIKLTEDMLLPSVRAELDEKTELVLGGGPSLQELQHHIQKLERANAELLTRVEKLQTEIDQIKKK